MSTNWSDKKYYGLVVLIWLVYLSLSLFAPVINSNNYSLSPLQLAFIKLTVALPLLVIWLAAAYSIVGLRRYVEIIKGSPDGQVFAGLTRGLTILVASIMVTGISGQLRPYAFKAGLAKIVIIYNNYLQVLLPLVAFWLMYRATRRLVAIVGAKQTAVQQLWLFLLFVVLAPIYTWLVFHNPNRFTPTSAKVVYASNYLTDPQILISIVMPYLIVWALGALTVQNLILYGRHVKGQIYKAALSRLSYGLIAVIILSIMLQFISAISGTIAALNLGGILALVYFILIIYAAGYISIAQGARRLSKIEEVV